MRFRLFVVLLVMFAACGTDSNSAPPTSADSTTVVYLTRDAGSGSSHLISVDIETEEAREIASLGYVNPTFSVDPEGVRIALATDLTDDPQLLLVDIQTGAVTTLTDSQGGDHSATLGPGGRIAYCDSQGNFRVGEISAIEASSIVQTHRPAARCPTAGWSTDSMIAFLAEFPLNDPRRETTAEALYLRDARGSMSSVELAGVVGYGPTSWSNDGQRVAFSAREDMFVTDITTSAVRVLGKGTDPQFSRNSSDQLVAFHYDGSGSTIDVWDGDEIVASLPWDEAVAAWCPGGNDIAFASTTTVGIWNWLSGEVRVLERTNVGAGSFIGHSVACF